MSSKVCFVPNCDSNKPGVKSKQKRFFYCAPKDEIKRSNWARLIRRDDFETIPENFFVCNVHFEQSCFIKDNVYIVNGEKVTMAKTRWSLTDDALPTIFPKRNVENVTKTEGRGRPKKMKVEAISKGKIKNFKELLQNIDWKKLDLPQLWGINVCNEGKDEYMLISEVLLQNNVPTLRKCVKINQKLDVSVFLHSRPCDTVNFIPVSNIGDINVIISHVDDMQECIGVEDFDDIFVEEHGEKIGSVWYAYDCDRLLSPPEKSICQGCTRLKYSLMHRRKKIQDAEPVYFGLHNSFFDS